MDASLSDICIGTSAAPTYLPAHYFETKDSWGNKRKFNLVDGGVAANNPVPFISCSFLFYLFNFFLNRYSIMQWLYTDTSFLSSLQTLIAINQVTKEITKERTDVFPLNPKENGRFLVLSLGTGSPKADKKYDAKMAAKWGVLGWLVKGGACPLFDVFNRASGDMVDYHISTVFQALHSQENYLRIQVRKTCKLKLVLLLLLFCYFTLVILSSRMIR